jgi:hypothetical protein
MTGLGLQETSLTSALQQEMDVEDVETGMVVWFWSGR